MPLQHVHISWCLPPKSRLSEACTVTDCRVFVSLHICPASNCLLYSAYQLTLPVFPTHNLGNVEHTPLPCAARLHHTARGSLILHMCSGSSLATRHVNGDVVRQIARTFSTLLITACCLLSPPKDQAKCSIAYSSTRLSSGHWLNWSVNIMSCCLPSSENGCVSRTSRTYLMTCTCTGCVAASYHACLPALLVAFLPSADLANLSLTSSACRQHSSRQP